MDELACSIQTLAFHHKSKAAHALSVQPADAVAVWLSEARCSSLETDILPLALNKFNHGVTSPV